MITDGSSPPEPSDPEMLPARYSRGRTVLMLIRRWPLGSALMLTAVTVGLLVGAGVLAEKALNDRDHAAALKACPPTRDSGPGCVHVLQGTVVSTWQSGGYRASAHHVQVDVGGRTSSVEIAWGNNPALHEGQSILVGSDFGHIIIVAPLSASPYYDTTDHPIYAQEYHEMTALLLTGLAVMFGVLCVYAWVRKVPSATEPQRVLGARMAAAGFWFAAIFSWAAWWFTGMPPNRDLLLGIGITVAFMLPGVRRMRRRASHPEPT